MKRLLIVCLLILSVVAARATSTINLGASMLYNANGTTPMATGMLVQLILSPQANGFAPPDSSSFTGNSDDIVLASFMTSSSGTAAQPIVVTYTGAIAAGEQILLRWFPTISGSAPPSAPSAGTPYGQFRIDATENFSSGPWTLPADGTLAYDLNFLTVAGGGTEPESAGRASLVVLAAIPEPSTFAFLVVGLAGVVFLRRRGKIA